MLSIIICSICKDFYDRFEKSLVSTIEIPYEIIVINNDIEKLSLSKAYNQGGRMSKFDYLLFVHEDVEFLEKGWAKSLLSILRNTQIGIVGIAGSTYLPSVPSGWYLPDEKYNNVFIHQGFKYKNAPIRFDEQGSDLTPVYLLDGVFLAMRKELWKEFLFNEKLSGFHAYDVDICQRVSSKYQNYFTKQIEILHKSEGKVDKTYFDVILNYKNAYSKYHYPKRDFKVELVLLKQFYSHIRCFYDKNECITKIKEYHSIRILGINGYFTFKKFLKNAK